MYDNVVLYLKPKLVNKLFYVSFCCISRWLETKDEIHFLLLLLTHFEKAATSFFELWQQLQNSKQSNLVFHIWSLVNERNNIYQIHIVNMPEQLKHIQQSSYLLLFASMCYCFQWQIEWGKVYRIILFYRQSFITFMWRLLGSPWIWKLKIVQYLLGWSFEIQPETQSWSTDCTHFIFHFV